VKSNWHSARKVSCCTTTLTEALNLIYYTDLAIMHGEIYSDIADAHFHCGEAIHKIDNHLKPDQ
jgi:hypothetical protein